MTARYRVRAGGYGGAEAGIRPHRLPRSHALSGALASAGPAMLLIAAAIIVRVIPWIADYPLHRDEALYGYWARLIASGRDPLLLTPWIDKPPLVLYLLAGSLRAFGVSVLALRLPGMIASALTVPAVYGLARRVYGDRTALLAAALAAASPFAILFSPTAFTDPWLTLWLVLAAWAALAGRSFLAGLALGLAVASKQQGVLGVPLILAIIALRSRRAEERGGRGMRFLLRAFLRPLLLSILGFALVFGPVTYWDSLRWVNRPSFWDRSLATYGGLYVAPIAQWPSRAAAWATQLGYLFGFPALSASMLLLATAAGSSGLLRRVSISRRSTRQADSPHPFADDVDRLLAAYAAGYLALHVIMTFQPWDRYLLPLVPLVSLLAARGIALAARRALADADAGWPAALAQADASRLKPADPHAPGAALSRLLQPSGIAAAPTRRALADADAGWPAALAQADASRLKPAGTALSRLLQQRRRAIAVICALGLALALGCAAWLGAAGRLPVGSDHGAYAGLDQVVAILRSQPADAVIYHRWLSWHYDFYLYDAPQERRWWGTGQKLADDASHTASAEPGRPQWIVLPAWEPGAEAAVGQALAPRGLALTEMRRIYRPDSSLSFTMYRIVQPPAEPAP